MVVDVTGERREKVLIALNHRRDRNHTSRKVLIAICNDLVIFNITSMLYGISPFFLSPHLFNSGVFRPKFDEELGLFGDRLFGRFGDKSVDEDVDDLQSRVPEWNDDQDFGTNETAIAEFQ